jgi:hypothetical protein
MKNRSNEISRTPGKNQSGVKPVRMVQRQASLAGIMLLLATAAFPAAAGNEKENAELMPFLTDVTACHACHTQREQDGRLKDPARACSNMCRTCHKETGKHHPVGIALDRKPSSALSLTSGNELACVTCHDLKGNRFDTSSWRGESLFSSLFRRQSQYKTYYLATRNNKGQLCRNCH